METIVAIGGVAMILGALGGTDIQDGYHQVPKHDGSGYHQVPVHKVGNHSPCPDNAVAVTNSDGTVAYYTCRY